MTNEHLRLVHDLRLLMLRTGYEPIYIVDNETLIAVEEYISEKLEATGHPPILVCGKEGLIFKGCQLVLKVK